MTYRPIASTEVDPDSPVTATLMQALAENHLAVVQLEPTAIDEGEVNGAQFYQHELVTDPGNTDAKVYDQTIDGTVAVIQVDLGTDKLLSFEYELLFVEVSTSSSTASTQIRFFKETDATFTGWESVGVTLVNAANFANGRTRFSILPLSPIINAVSDFSRNNTSEGSPARSASWDMGIIQNVTNLEIKWSNGSNFDAGKIYLLKRQTYVGRE